MKRYTFRLLYEGKPVGRVNIIAYNPDDALEQVVFMYSDVDGYDFELLTK